MTTTPPEAAALADVQRLPYARVLGWLDARLGARRRWLLTLDGRSGSGKTDLSALVVGRHSGTQVLHLDDLYRDWDDLPSGLIRARHLAEAWCRGEEGSYLPTRWPGLPPQVRRAVTAGAPLVIEGVGATWVGRGVADAAVWLDVARDLRRLRALARDGETFAPHWLTWEHQEDAWFDTHPPHPDLVVPLR